LINKKTVFLPYDFDTANGTNNEGALEFSYNLEDTDKIGGNKDVYNGQQSVLWNNVRACFFNDIKTMYQNLRSQNKLSYEIVEQMFEDHQSKWPEALVNKDSQFTYLDPLVNPENGAKPTAAYLSMLQGLKTEQRKWWLYNRFRYEDSRFNAGDALTDVITIRGYAKDNITVTPYADIYASIKYGSYLVQERATRNVAIVLACPLDNVNDTEIYIYSASQLASIGDLSGLKIGYADFSNGIRLQNLKIGDSSTFYENDNLLDLYLGNNVLLQTLDCRNCVNLGGSRVIGGDRVVSKTPSPDASGCIGIEEAYFDNTSVKGVIFPVGGVLRVVHLPATITNLTLRDQTKLTDLTVASYANVTTLRLENCSSVVDTVYILNQIQDNSRVRLVGFRIDVSSTSEIDAFYAKLDKMRGLDEYGNTLDNAAAIGTIHIGSIDGDDAAAYKARYPYITIDADHISCTVTYKTYDGSTVIDTEIVNDKGNGTKTNSTARTADTQYIYTPNGWSLEPNGDPDPQALTFVDTDRTVYAAYTKTLQKYTVTWKNSNGTTLETDNNVEYGTTPSYNSATPVDPSGNGSTFKGWTPDIAPVTGNATYTASFKPVWTVTFKSQDGATTLGTSKVVDGNTATYTGTTPTNTDNTTFLGWAGSTNATVADTDILKNITANKTVYAAFESLVEDAEITDTWDQILAAIDDGTYKTKYKIGNYKPLDLGSEGTVNAQIVGIDLDSDKNASTIPISFITKELLSTAHNMNSTNTTEGGWPATAMRSYLTTTVKPLIPASISNRIVAANKTYKDYTNGVQTSTDELWIPSEREVFNSGSYETTGPTYTSIFKDNASRIKTQNGSARIWWLRSANNSTSFRYVSGGGSSGNNNVYNTHGVALGFCLGTETQAKSISFAALAAAMDDGTYATKFNVGDMFDLDLGTEDKLHAQIVAFDADDKADGSGKAKVSVITHELLSTANNMNLTSTTEGGWPATSMRSYLTTTVKPLIPASISDRIVSVNKTYKDYTNGVQTSADELWIPSEREVLNSGSYETTGPTYTSIFKDSASRIKTQNGSASYWWLRSANNSTVFRCVNNVGSADGNYANNTYGVALGFCLD